MCVLFNKTSTFYRMQICYKVLKNTHVVSPDGLLMMIPSSSSIQWSYENLKCANTLKNRWVEYTYFTIPDVRDVFCDTRVAKLD